MSAEWLFCSAFARYVGDATPEALKERENELVAELLRRRKSYDLLLATEARVRARAQLADHRTFFDSMKATYFMFERWPGNQDRFQLAYGDCGGEGGEGNGATDT